MAVRGSCLCGAVTFEIERAAGPAEFCHCNRCRKVSGSASLLSIYVLARDYRFLAAREWVKSYDDADLCPDKHICVEFAPAWDRIDDGLPSYTLPQIHALRGHEVPKDFKVRWHVSSRRPRD